VSGSLDQLEAKHLIKQEASSSRASVGLGYLIYGEVIRKYLPPRRTREIARTLANNVTELGMRAEDILRVGV
jgi:hypothetical protein